MRALVSFPGHSRLQFLIAYSMQKWRGRSGRKSCAWHLVDMRVDTRVDMMGAVSDRCNSQTLHWSVLNLPNNELYWRCLSNITALSFWTRYYKKDLKILHQAPPPSCLPSHLPDFFSQASPSIFAYCKLSKTGGRNRLGTRLWVAPLRSLPKSCQQWLLTWFPT